MLMVGASHSFIKWPYLLEGCIQGIIGTFIALLGLFSLFQVLINQVSEIFVEFTGNDIIFFAPEEALFILLAGGFLGFIGSHFAVKKVVV